MKVRIGTVVLNTSRHIKGVVQSEWSYTRDGEKCQAFWVLWLDQSNDLYSNDTQHLQVLEF